MREIKQLSIVSRIKLTHKVMFAWLISLTIMTGYPYIKEYNEGELQKLQFSSVARQVDYNTTMIHQHTMLMQEIYSEMGKFDNN